ncbi:hypothetical protein PRIPAC_86636, partial [Pristionchus pacificus]|uniref:Uncharacterized protein n=1 Tax=Pristionchus pacificus TaxID=54126 RepID=A0A2A6CIX1_PRIPA
RKKKDELKLLLLLLVIELEQEASMDHLILPFEMMLMMLTSIEVIAPEVPEPSLLPPEGKKRLRRGDQRSTHQCDGYSRSMDISIGMTIQPRYQFRERRPIRGWKENIRRSEEWG